MKIGVDLDEVLAESAEEVLMQNNYKIGNKFLRKEDITNYYIWEMEGIGLNMYQAMEIFKNVFYNDKELEIKPVFGSLEKLTEWKNKGYELIVVTARNELFRNYTNSWLEKYFPNIFSDIHFVGYKDVGSTPKSVVCKNIGVDIMIEDNFEYAKDVANCGIKTFLIEKPWNKNLGKSENIVRVKSWDEIEI